MLKPRWDKLGISVNWGVGSVREPRAGPRELSDASPSPSPPRPSPAVLNPPNRPRGLAALRLRGARSAALCSQRRCEREGLLAGGRRRKCTAQASSPKLVPANLEVARGICAKKEQPALEQGRAPAARACLLAALPAGRPPPPAVWPYALTRVRLQAVRGRVLRVSEWARGAQRLHGQVQPLLLPVSQFPLFI